MTLIEPLMLAGAAVGAIVGAILGFASGPLWGVGGLVAGFFLGGLATLLGLLFLGLLITAALDGPRHALDALRAMWGRRPGS